MIFLSVMHKEITAGIGLLAQTSGSYDSPTRAIRSL